MCGVLHLTKHLLTKEARRHVYHTLLYPSIIYCNTVWAPVPPSKLKPLVVAHKRAVRILAGKPRYEHTNNLFIETKLLKLKEINIYFSTLFVYKCLNNIIQNKFYTFRTNIRYTFREHSLLEVPHVRSNQSQTCITYCGAKIWNQLPLSLRTVPSLTSFKLNLKKYLLSSYHLDE